MAVKKTSKSTIKPAKSSEDKIAIRGARQHN